MNLYTPEVGNPQKLTQHRRETPEKFANTNDSLDSGPKLKRLLTAVLLIAVAIGMGLGFWSLSRQLAPQLISSSTSAADGNTPLLAEKSVAVLPFENLSEDKESAFLADGVQGDILTALSKVADLKVISRTSVNSYAAGTARNLREIAESLGKCSTSR